MSNGKRLAVIVLVLLVAAGSFVILRPDNAEQPKSTTAATPAVASAETTAGQTAPSMIGGVVVKDGKPVGGIASFGTTKGQYVQISVLSDVADEVHIHGYDLSKEAVPGKTVTFDFKANLDGVFEIELENSKTQIAELKVQP